jgi:hypothetical protein
MGRSLAGIWELMERDEVVLCEDQTGAAFVRLLAAAFGQLHSQSFRDAAVSALQRLIDLRVLPREGIDRGQHFRYQFVDSVHRRDR